MAAAASAQHRPSSASFAAASAATCCSFRVEDRRWEAEAKAFGSPKAVGGLEEEAERQGKGGGRPGQGGGPSSLAAYASSSACPTRSVPSVQVKRVGPRSDARSPAAAARSRSAARARAELARSPPSTLPPSPTAPCLVGSGPDLFRNDTRDTRTTTTHISRHRLVVWTKHLPGLIAHLAKKKWVAHRPMALLPGRRCPPPSAPGRGGAPPPARLSRSACSQCSS